MTVKGINPRDAERMAEIANSLRDTANGETCGYEYHSKEEVVAALRELTVLAESVLFFLKSSDR